jgi:hypothetical protein
MQTPNPKQVVRIDLTTEQKQQIRSSSGLDGEALELTIQELEERIAPRIVRNHNETLLVDR